MFQIVPAMRNKYLNKLKDFKLDSTTAQKKDCKDYIKRIFEKFQEECHYNSICAQTWSKKPLKYNHQFQLLHMSTKRYMSANIFHSHFLTKRLSPEVDASSQYILSLKDTPSSSTHFIFYPWDNNPDPQDILLDENSRVKLIHVYNGVNYTFIERRGY